MRLTENSNISYGIVAISSLDGTVILNDNGAILDLSVPGGGGGVSSVSSANAKLTIANPTSTPVITYQIGGSSKTNDYVMLITDFIILMKATGKTITLPDATLVTPFLEYTVILGNFATCTVNTVSAQTISGQSTITLTNYQSITVLSDGTQWYLF